MSRKEEIFLFDILVAILKIEEVSKKFNNSQDLLYSFTDWDSVIREFEIIGEATKHLINKNILPKEYREIVDFRNLIIHKYFGIDEEIVWSIIHKELPKFKRNILKLITKIEPNLKKELINSFLEDNKHLNFITKKLKEIQWKN